ncbi:cobalamin biosynthesis protein CobG [Streptomyces sp. PA5.6]|uniref:cobalamin biosynthesis protein CobG n=1 Tax=Streptomyces sp. PA5.6 TaxID=3035651 RepID=UPI00390477B3
MPPTPASSPNKGESLIRDRGDACPGALRLHRADDGLLARLRLPGGLLTARQVEALGVAAEGLADGNLSITSRGNVELRGLGDACGGELSALLAEAGLLPSERHERVRNVVASPLAGTDGIGHADVQLWARDLDGLLCSEDWTPRLSGRFLFTLDDGRGDVARLGGDVTLIAESGGTAVVGVRSVSFRIAGADAPRAALAAAKAFLTAASAAGNGAWRVAELPPGQTVDLGGALEEAGVEAVRVGAGGGGSGGSAVPGGLVASGGSAAPDGSVAPGDLVTSGGSAAFGGAGGPAVSGGPAASGGSVACDGSAAPGDLVASGGSAASGGSVACDGSAAPGDLVASGGSAASGGSVACDGSAVPGDLVASGGSAASGGSVACDGSAVPGDPVASGGSAASGGSVAFGGAGGPAVSGGLVASEGSVAFGGSGGRAVPGGSGGGAPDGGAVAGRSGTASPGGPPPGVIGRAVSVYAPLGRVTVAQWRALLPLPTDELRVTPWRGLVIPGFGDEGAARERLVALDRAGLLADPDSPWLGVGACTGRPGCAKSLADVRADAVPGHGSLPVHWSGCERRCGHPHGDWVDVLATGDGTYEVTLHTGGSTVPVTGDTLTETVTTARTTTKPTATR